MKPELTLMLNILKEIWWFFFPFLLKGPFRYFYRWWRVEKWLLAKYHPRVYEIKFPKEIKKPMRAMENVFSALHGAFFKSLDWWDTWATGEILHSFSLELVSMEGKIHFYIRCEKDYEAPMKNAIHAQYPEAEIEEVEDYTKFFPPDIPNEKWGLWGCCYRLAKEDPYPIKTYSDFETEMEREKKAVVDPMAQLLEGLSRMEKGEYMWLQIIARPLGAQYAKSFLDEAKKIRDLLAKRGVPKKKTIFHYINDFISSLIEDFHYVISYLLTGTSPKTGGTEKPSSPFPPELRLTPGERLVVEKIEKKISKPIFQCNIRFLLFGKREVFDRNKLRLILNFFSSFNTVDTNALFPTLTAKIAKHWFLPLNLIRERRLYLRERRLWRYYLSRDNHFFPRSDPPKYHTTFILNIEELSTIFHFTPWELVPAAPLSWVETKKLP